MLGSVKILRNIQRTIRTIYKREKGYWGADHRRARNIVFLKDVRQIYIHIKSRKSYLLNYKDKMIKIN